MIARCSRCNKFLLLSTFLLFIILFLLSQFTLNASKVRLVEGSFIQRNLDKLPSSFRTNMNNWVSKNILRLKWENIHCRRNNGSNSETVSQWIKPLSRQLDIKDGQSLFDANSGCLEWLTHFRSEFPNLEVGGYDVDDDAIDYAKRVFNDTPGSFVKKLSQTKNLSFHNAINFGGLQTMRADKQCSKVKAIFSSLKPGGTLYLGHNLERNCNTSSCIKCFTDMEKIGFVVLDTCFWSKICLRDHPNLMDIYYIPEREFFHAPRYFGACQTAVFIKKKAISRARSARNINERLAPQKHLNIYRC